MILVCDDQGNSTGEYFPMAIAVFLHNQKGEVLLQKRKHKIFDNIWDLTGATDLYHLENGLNETFEEAARRCLKREYDIERDGVMGLKKKGGIF